MKFRDRKFADLTPEIIQAELDRSHQAQREYAKTLRSIKRGLEANAELDAVSSDTTQVEHDSTTPPIDTPAPAIDRDAASKLLGEGFVREIEAVKTQAKVNVILADAEKYLAVRRLSPADMKVVLAACETKRAALDEKGSSDAS